ncbi:plant intracellular Ras-group-related LRR protein 1-like [Cannabis sativa]|uniref:plant intracellular Ras-group-related LRR protein 1-like n=1 Tax=Cannabis sativa TaxID=3483 RepID=UPI0029CA58B0|nr:plant intracellular Ras-group-related LRR protein 1-like [Cannabis sativa]
MPCLTDPKLIEVMTRAVTDVAQTRSVLKTIGDRPDHEAVDVAKAKLADIEANLAKQLEDLVLSPRPDEVDRLQWRSQLADKENECRKQSEKEKQLYKAIIQLDEMHEAYEKLLKDAKERLEKIYEMAEAGGSVEEAEPSEEDQVTDEVNEEVIGILQEASGTGLERVDLSGRQLKFLADISSNQFEGLF